MIIGCSKESGEDSSMWNAIHLSSGTTVWTGPIRTSIEDATADADTYLENNKVEENEVFVVPASDIGNPSFDFLASFAPISRDLVAENLGIELVELTDSTRFVGTWSQLTHRAKHEPTLVTFNEDGTIDRPSHTDDGPPVKWTYKNEVLIETFWVPPMPEYGITEESWDSLDCRCALTTDGRIVLWNSDGSVIKILTRQT